MKKIEFYRKTRRVVTSKREVTLQEFSDLLEKYQPKKIRCEPWSKSKPIYTIIRYIGGGDVVAIFHPISKEPIETNFKKMYQSLQYGGLLEAYFLI